MGLISSARLCLFVALAVSAVPTGARLAQGQQPPVRPAMAPAQDFRAPLRAQVEDELAQLRPRLAKAEADAKLQAERYREMAAAKAEMARKSAEKAQADRARADAMAAKKGYAPRLPGKAASAGKGAAAKDAKAPGGGDKSKGGEGAAGGGEGAPRKVDPVLTQHYLVLSLRDQIRQLRERIAYLEGLLARL
jgi:membrane protein involved in colicin uptake